MNPLPTSKLISIEKRGRGVVGELIGKHHQFYEDRSRMLSDEIELVRAAARGEIFAVFDGVGSAPKGMHAAQKMADELIEFFTAPDEHPATENGLETLLLTANREITNWGFIPGTYRPVGACAGSIVWLRDEILTLFHAGDTETWLIDGESLQRLTPESSGTNTLSQYFGQGDDLRMDRRQISFPDQAKLLLFSDGLRKVITRAEVEATLRSKASPELTVQQLMEKAAANGHPDDVTVMLITDKT
ncbi:MAG: SpoIIE family protein phosphatase [Verrucomicrobiales bacterium]|nr:SpoIIE family protein phosphatase [Verrucomicrobiales bacterium]